MSKEILIGQIPIENSEKSVTGKTAMLNGEEFNMIENYDHMDPFFMTIVSSTDHWMFISSNGGLSAGRKNAENALFPYYTDDKITESSDRVGSKTIFKIIGENSVKLWEPFSTYQSSFYSTTRNLYKNRFGSKIVFEEINHDLKLRFRYSWQFSEKFGFVKKSELINQGQISVKIHVLDGLLDLMPYGVNRLMQASTSNLVNGYKRNVLEPETQMGVFTLSAMIVDRAEPSEALKATTVWSHGLASKTVLLCNKQLKSFSRGKELITETDIKGTAGSYLVESEFHLDKGESRNWMFIAEINQDRADVSNLKHFIRSNEPKISEEIHRDVQGTSEELRRLVAKADGLQLTEDKMSSGRHISNVMFNIMRGGIFDEDYDVHLDDFRAYLKEINVPVFEKYEGDFKRDQVISYLDLLRKAEEIGDADLIRISYEYLPLTFSRRHGDPSRPWNKFNIDLKYPDGSKKRSYEGNWRDIFQNWEALAYSFPKYIQGMIFKFLNASTIDGYNPYRITRKGIDWEIIEPDDPWSYIGYWGDHQIIYLQKLLECAYKHDSSALDTWMNEKLFVYANVPYTIKSYDDIIQDPQDTIDFNHYEQEQSDIWLNKLGGDGKLKIKDGELLKATFMEKLLVTLLSKLSNFVPEGGIWLNTQRPEWNDANNALVGNGISMVTLYYMRRFCHFLTGVLNRSSAESYQVHTEVLDLFQGILEIMKANEGSLESSFSNSDRKQMVDALGRAGEAYRNKAYTGFEGKAGGLDREVLIHFLELTLQFIDHSIRANKREDGLYHSYNLLQFNGDELTIDNLYEMLEGQVAVLSSGYLEAKESLDLLDALKVSKMFREDQYSYYLYPNRNIPHFLDKNRLPADFVKKSALIQKLKTDGNTHLVRFDEEGAGYFNGDLHNAKDVSARLDNLSQYVDLVDSERSDILEVFEEMFDHKSFTGRSGTFFAYEGLGSIYWHMVSKLLYATQETIWNGADSLSQKERSELVQHYYEIRAGIGINKTPDLYGAFPTDPYSHTPAHKGAQQPGMTGQVKEDVLNRWAELGVVVEGGIISFDPKFLNKDEFLHSGDKFEYYDLSNTVQNVPLSAGQLAFTYCQVPIIYELAKKTGIEVQLMNSQIALDSNTLSAELSEKIFRRTGNVTKIHVFLNY